MECALCGRPISSLDEGGICARCSDTKISHAAHSASLRRSLIQRELEQLRSELYHLINQRYTN